MRMHRWKHVSEERRVIFCIGGASRKSNKVVSDKTRYLTERDGNEGSSVLEDEIRNCAQR